MIYDYTCHTDVAEGKSKSKVNKNSYSYDIPRFALFLKIFNKYSKYKVSTCLNFFTRYPTRFLPVPLNDGYIALLNCALSKGFLGQVHQFIHVPYPCPSGINIFQVCNEYEH